jgi:hypothetical protein
MKQPPPPCLGIAPSVQCPGPARHSAAETQQSRPWPGDARASTSPSLDSPLGSPEPPRTQPKGWIMPHPLEHRHRNGGRSIRPGKPHRGTVLMEEGPGTAWIEQAGGPREEAPMSTPPFHPRNGSRSSRPGTPCQDALRRGGVLMEEGQGTAWLEGPGDPREVAPISTLHPIPAIGGAAGAVGAAGEQPRPQPG